MKELASKILQKRAAAVAARPAPIVPPGTIAGRALSAVIAIMTFLACLTVGSVSLVNRSAETWQSQISREATIQIRPAQNFDIETALTEAETIARNFDGVANTRIIDIDDTAELLEPWLGSGLDLNELPVPRLVVITIDEASPPDFDALRATITEAIPNASLDDHRGWVDRLVSMARTTAIAGIVVLILVLSALVMTVIFATRGAMAGNHELIEVLHFIGAKANFIAGQFQRRFLGVSLRGAAIGGVGALLLFWFVRMWSRSNLASAEGEQISAFFGDFGMGPGAYFGVFAVLCLVCVLTVLTARFTVLRTLADIDERRADPSR